MKHPGSLNGNIELFYGLVCPYCRVLRKMVKKFLMEEKGSFIFTETLVNSPSGMVRSLKKGIHSVPTLLLDDKIIFRDLPTEEELFKVLKNYSGG